MLADDRGSPTTLSKVCARATWSHTDKLRSTKKKQGVPLHLLCNHKVHHTHKWDGHKLGYRLRARFKQKKTQRQRMQRRLGHPCHQCLSLLLQALAIASHSNSSRIHTLATRNHSTHAERGDICARARAQPNIHTHTPLFLSLPPCENSRHTHTHSASLLCTYTAVWWCTDEGSPTHTHTPRTAKPRQPSARAFCHTHRERVRVRESARVRV